MSDVVFGINEPLPAGLAWADISVVVLTFLANAGDVAARQELERRLA